MQEEIKKFIFSYTNKREAERALRVDDILLSIQEFQSLLKTGCKHEIGRIIEQYNKELIHEKTFQKNNNISESINESIIMLEAIKEIFFEVFGDLLYLIEDDIDIKENYSLNIPWKIIWKKAAKKYRKDLHFRMSANYELGKTLNILMKENEILKSSLKSAENAMNYYKKNMEL